MVPFAAFGLAWAVMLAAGALALIFALKRRCCEPVRTVHSPVPPIPRMPSAERSRRGGAAGRSFGGVAIVLVVLAVVFMYRVKRHETAAMAVWKPHVTQTVKRAMSPQIEAPTPPGYASAQLTPPQLPLSNAQPPRKSKNWLKPDPPAPATPTPPWSAAIDHVRVLALPNSESDVLNEVCAKLKNDLGLRITPPPSFAANKQWVRVPEKTEYAIVHDPQIGDYAKVHYKFELSDEGWRELGRIDRADLAESRMEWAARGLGLLTVLLGAIAAYIRLDDWTKGYFSGRLFVAAGVLAAGLGYAILAVG